MLFKPIQEHFSDEKSLCISNNFIPTSGKSTFCKKCCLQQCQQNTQCKKKLTFQLSCLKSCCFCRKRVCSIEKTLELKFSKGLGSLKHMTNQYFINKTSRRSALVSRQNILRKKCPYSELFWSAFFRLRNEYGEIRSISPYSVRM